MSHQWESNQNLEEGVVCGRGVCASRSDQILAGVITSWVVGDGVLIWRLAVISGRLVFSPDRKVEQETKITLNPTSAAIIKDKVNTAFVDIISTSGQTSQ